MERIMNKKLSFRRKIIKCVNEGKTVEEATKSPTVTLSFKATQQGDLIVSAWIGLTCSSPGLFRKVLAGSEANAGKRFLRKRQPQKRSKDTRSWARSQTAVWLARNTQCFKDRKAG
jgi:hypothetical protein